MCSWPVFSGEVVCRSVDGRLRGPALGGGPTRRQLARPQGAEALALTGRRTMKARGGLDFRRRSTAGPNCCRLFSPFGTGRPLAIPLSAVAGFSGGLQLLSRYRRCSQARKSLIMLGLLAMKGAPAWSGTRLVIHLSEVSEIFYATEQIVLPSSRTSRIAPALNSSLNCRRTRRAGLVWDMRDIVSTFRKMSTRSDLCRVRDYAEVIQGPRLKCP